MPIPHYLAPFVTSTHDTLGGMPRFKDTRVPVIALLDSLESGESIESFLDGYPGVTRQQVMAILQWRDDLAKQALSEASGHAYFA